MRKHTVNLPPGTVRSYRVTADALGRWAYHCHLGGLCVAWFAWSASGAQISRYEFRREVAPYVGLVRGRSFGATEQLRGGDGDDTSLVAGIRLCSSAR